MLEFQEISIEDKSRLQPMLLNEKNRGCEYTFGNAILWVKIYATKVAYHNESAVIRHDRHGAGYLFPIGDFDLKNTLNLMLEDAKQSGHEERFSILAADKADFEAIDAIYPGRFEYRFERDYAEYIYLAKNLITLEGKKYHNKRNHIARFRDNHPDYEFRAITKDNIEQVMEMNKTWCERYATDASESLSEEITVASRALDMFFDIGLEGGFIQSGDEILAYSIGEPINSNTYCIHIEKAFHDIQGSYAIINRDFAAHFCKDYEYINREDDVGQEGLRKAKLSYYPEFLSDKITIFPKV
ncbi:MAG: phosphatidylglycerol lysyltransferase domain-containing protein [Oscillospiraceae bacterium]|nr:phosphatidylglycerol lysyltransferase domain-containing protein [Oscillospiraceae bacterium]